MTKSDTAAAPTAPDELELPDWSGMEDGSARISAQAAFAFVEQYRAWFPEAFRRHLASRPPKCPVEFTL